MIRRAYLLLLVLCLALSAKSKEVQEEATPESQTEEVARRELTDSGYVIRYGDNVYRYPFRIVPVVPQRSIQIGDKNPIETNEIEIDEPQRRPLFFFTTYDTPEDPAKKALPTSRPYIEIRRKRNVENLDVPESSRVGKLRRKRTYCNKCGGGGGGGYYVPVSYSVYPVYYGGGGGGGNKCYTCGGRGGGGGGGGGSYSYSSSSAQSSSGSFGWGKK